MIDCGSLEYAHARLHARHGQRPDEAAWRRIETLRDVAPLLDAARATGLRPWLVGIGSDSAAHQVEAALRGHWRALVDEVAAWMPGRWQASVAWCVVLPDLALLQHLARGGEPPVWMREDSIWRDLAAAPPQARAAALAGGPFAALAATWPAPQGFGQCWRSEWQRRLPAAPGANGKGGPVGADGRTHGSDPGDADRGDSLAQLVRLLVAHGKAFTEASGGQGWLLRGALRVQLARLLHRAALEPAAAFIHIALCALDLERLRAELLRRLLFRRWTRAEAA